MIASETSLKIKIPMSSATAAPMKARINPSDSTILLITTTSAYLKEKFDDYNPSILYKSKIDDFSTFWVDLRRCF